MVVELIRILPVPIIEDLEFKRLLDKVAAEIEVDPTPPPPFVETVLVTDPLAERAAAFERNSRTASLNELAPALEVSNPFGHVIKKAISYASTLLA